MKFKFWPQLDRDSMSSRARGYLTVAAAHFGIIGLTILIKPLWYSGAAFAAIVDYNYLILWGDAYLLTGILCAIAAVTSWPSFARAGLTVAFVVLVVSAFAVSWGIVETWLDDDPIGSSPVLPVSFLALAAKDLLMVRRPLRTPTEDQTNARRHEDAEA